MKPAFERNNISVVMSVNDNFIPYVSTFLLSVVDHSSDKYNYDFIILNKDISSKRKQVLIELVKEKKNFQIRFYDVGNRFDKYEMFVHEHFTLETYFRLLIPEVLEGYDKVLYLDADMIIMTDLFYLYSEDVSGFLLGASRDIGMLTFANEYEATKNILKKVVQIKNIENYFNAGVLVINLKEFRKKYTTEYLLEVAASNKWPTVDQDVLNYLCQGQVKILDMSWNVMFDYIDRMKLTRKLDKKYYLEYLDARKKPKIIHYAGSPKPWQVPASDFTEEFWHYARKSPFYEEILFKMVEYTMSHG